MTHRRHFDREVIHVHETGKTGKDVWCSIWRINCRRAQLLPFLIPLLLAMLLPLLLLVMADAVQARYIFQQQTGFTIRVPAASGG